MAAPEAALRPCPTCRRLTPWAGNPHRPFCSQRCRVTDLGDWAAERHRVPGEPIGDDDDGDSTPTS